MNFSTVYGFNYSQYTLKSFSLRLQSFLMLFIEFFCLHKSPEPRTMSPKIIRKNTTTKLCNCSQQKSHNESGLASSLCFVLMQRSMYENRFHDVTMSQSQHIHQHRYRGKKGEVKWIKFG